jgi:hypothetical protein
MCARILLPLDRSRSEKQRLEKNKDQKVKSIPQLDHFVGPSGYRRPLRTLLASLPVMYKF